ncbi:hypothetical protein MTO96_003323 [Rhipicephalus appendiculatus]
MDGGKAVRQKWEEGETGGDEDYAEEFDGGRLCGRRLSLSVPPPGLDSVTGVCRGVSSGVREESAPQDYGRAKARRAPTLQHRVLTGSRVTCFSSIGSGIVGIHPSARRDGQADECMPCF